ncbi:MAG: lipopolysaccharide kinase InaA family protein [Gemmataceae bacterium]
MAVEAASSISRTLADGTALHHRAASGNSPPSSKASRPSRSNGGSPPGQAKVVKQGPHRVVWRVDLPSISFHLKKNLVPNWRARIRGWLRGPKARREYGLIDAVHERGIPTAQPLAWAERQGESYLFTRTLEHVEPLHLFFLRTFQSCEDATQTRIRQAIACELGSLVAVMHQAGIDHRDLHAGNLLVRMGGERPRLFLIDLDAVKLTGPLEGERRLASLAMLNAWFRLHAERTDRLRFWKSYVAASPFLPWKKFGHDAVSMATALERRSAEYSLALWRGREPRCLGQNRYYQKLSAGAAYGHAVRDVDPSLLATQRWNARPTDAVLEPTEVDEGRHRWLPMADARSAKQAWKASQAFRERGLPTRKTLAVVVRNDGRGGQLLTAHAEDAIPLARVSRHAKPLDRRYWIRRLANAYRDLHDRGVSWREPRLESVLAAKADARRDGWAYPEPLSLFPRAREGLWFADLAGMRLIKAMGESDRQRDLALLLVQAADLSNADRLRFLRHYMRWGLQPKEDWKAWWGYIAANASGIAVSRSLETG